MTGASATAGSAGAATGSVRALILCTALSLIALGQAESYEIVPERSEARYRVREQLVGLSLPNDAVGVTSGVTGRIELNEQGSVLPGSKIIVDVSALQSDEGRRDNFVRRNTLQTDAFPTVVFVPTELRGLEFPFPESGAASFEIVGELTIRDVTREAVWQAEAEFGVDNVALSATTSFTFDDFGLSQPRVPVVLSVDDDIGLEVDFSLQQHPE